MFTEGKLLFWAAAGAVVSTSVMVWFGTGLDPWWPLMWFAPIPVLLFAGHSSWRSAAAVAAISWVAGNLNTSHYFGDVLHLPFAIRTQIIVLPALALVGAVLLFQALLKKDAWWQALVSFPAIWVSCEYLNNLVSPHGTAGNIAYTQLKFLPVLQLASVTGPWGISFVVLLFSSSLALGLHLRKSASGKALCVAGTGLSVVALVLVFGAARLALPTHPQIVRVGLVASDLPANEGVADAGAETLRVFHDYADKAEEVAARGAQVIVLPEKLGVVLDQDKVAVDAIFQPLADKTRATIVVGMVYASAPAKYNEARIYSPHALVLSYDKHHMLPPFESDLKPGTTPTLLSEPLGIWGIEICKDMDFTPLSRQYSKAGAGLMLVPAWDFNVDRIYHGHMAVMRGVESGFTVARAARGGYLTVSDDRGRILAEVQSDSASFATLTADVPVTHDATVYLLLGDWFAWVALAGVIFTFAQLYRAKNPLVRQIAARIDN